MSNQPSTTIVLVTSEAPLFDDARPGSGRVPGPLSGPSTKTPEGRAEMPDGGLEATVGVRL